MSTAILSVPITDDERAALERFHECVTDGEGYDVARGMMQRLAHIGLVRRVTGNIYEHTDFGLAVLGECVAPPPREPAPESVQDALPEEPTPEMQLAGAQAIRFDTTPLNKIFTANAAYRAMRAAQETT